MVNGEKNHWNKSQNQQEKNRMKKGQKKKKRKKKLQYTYGLKLNRVCWNVLEQVTI